MLLITQAYQVLRNLTRCGVLRQVGRGAGRERNVLFAFHSPTRNAPFTRFGSDAQ